MSSTFVVADTHWSHYNIVKFTRADGTKLRPWDTVEEMDRDMIELWNATVGPKDKVYVLGDWCINRRGLQIGTQLNGDKILIKGNHDNFKLDEYTLIFRDIRACRVLGGCNVIMSHIPVHESQLYRFKANIHGHLHDNVVMKDGQPDPRYICVSVEHTGFKPILLDKVLREHELLK